MCQALAQEDPWPSTAEKVKVKLQLEIWVLKLRMILALCQENGKQIIELGPAMTPGGREI